MPVGWRKVVVVGGGSVGGKLGIVGAVDIVGTVVEYDAVGWPTLAAAVAPHVVKVPGLIVAERASRGEGGADLP